MVSVVVYVVESASMEPSLHCANGPGCQRIRPDHVVVSDLPYLFDAPNRGDLVVLDLEHMPAVCSRRLIVKRLVALPGELIPDGARVPVASGARRDFRKQGRQPASTDRLGSDQYFVIGDNRAMSCDSRDFGPVPRHAILGKVISVHAEAWWHP